MGIDLGSYLLKLELIKNFGLMGANFSLNKFAYFYNRQINWVPLKIESFYAAHDKNIFMGISAAHY